MRARSRTIRGAALVIAVALAAAACGGSTPSTTDSTRTTSAGAAASAGSTATGTPITVLTITPSGTSGANFPDIPTVLTAFAKATNAAGGIAGHPLRVESCNDKNDPNTAGMCARQAVTDKAVAVLGSFSQFADSILPILGAAKIPYLAANAISGSEYSDTNSYPLVPGPIGFAALGTKAGQRCARTDIVTYDLPAAAGLAPFVTMGLAASNKTVDTTVKVPVTTTDFSSTVSNAKDADCIISILPEQALNQYLAKATSLGVSQTIFAPAGGVGSESLTRFKTQLEGSFTVSSFPIATDPVWAGMKRALAAEGKPNVDLTVPQNLNAWVSGVVFAKVAAGLTTFDAASFKAALDTASNLDTGGFTPPLDFTKPFPVPALARLFDTSLIGVDIKNGTLVQDGTFVDYKAALKS